jgi:hypothetical protein
MCSASAGELVPAARWARGKYPAPTTARNWILLEGFHLDSDPAMHDKERGGVDDRVRGGAGFEMCAAEVGFADAVDEGYWFAPDRSGWSKLDQVSTSA